MEECEKDCFACAHIRYDVKLVGTDRFYYCNLTKRPTKLNLVCPNYLPLKYYKKDVQPKQLKLF